MSDDVIRDSGGPISPVVRRGKYRGRPAIIKDYRTKHPLTRSLFAPSMVRREFEILKKLEGVSGVPRPYAILDGVALAMEYIEGRTLGKYLAGDLPVRVFDSLCGLVRDMHRRGVAHLDLRQKKNILITPDLQPYLIDFVTAVAPGPGSLLRPFLPALQRVDETGLLKFKRRNFPDLLTDADRGALRRHRFWRRFWIFTPRSIHLR